jgi:hypothetical protein
VKRVLLSAAILAATLLPLVARADVGPPAHLRISEREAGRFVVQWRVPTVLPQRAVPSPWLPETCEAAGDYSVTSQNRAWLFTQEWRCAGGIAGEVVGLRYPFPDLALTTVIRVHLLSGDRFAHVSTPGEGGWQLPRGTAAPDHLREFARSVALGAAHGVGSWAHLPFLVAAGLLGSARSAIRVVTTFTLGQLAGLLVTQVAPGAGPIPAEIAIGITGVLLAREALLRREGERCSLALAAAGGLVHGSAIGPLLVAELGDGYAGLPTQLLALLGMDAAHLVAAVLFAVLVVALSRRREGGPSTRWLAYGTGAAGIALTLTLALQGAVVVPAGAEIDVASAGVGPGGSAAAGSRRLAPASPDAPLQSYLVIEPFELRHEVMLRLGKLAPLFELDALGTIEVAEQEALAVRLSAFVAERTVMRADGRLLEGLSRRAYFMTVDATGALPRPAPLPEPVAEAFVGVVVSYPTEGIPGAVSLAWEPFPPEMVTLPVTTIDPEAVQAGNLTADDPRTTWRNELAEDPIPSIDAVAVEPPRLPIPLVTLPIAAGALIILIVGIRRRRAGPAGALFRVLLAVALAAGPIARTSLALPASAAGAPSERQARRILAGLLPNIYRAMEFRDEELIYDRLTISVTGETLAEIYVDQRRTLELEERGGAQARVESVEILGAQEIESSERGFRVRCIWTVGGMVTHFGHRHFRQNRYDARIAIEPVASAWKIRSVEILDQERLK